MTDAADPSAGAESIGFVIPYRDRQAHLQALYPRLLRYMRTRHPALGFRIYLVEQAAGKRFNRGLACNIGFLAARAHHSHVCFHDVDYLPVDVDYGPVDRPTRLIWHGLRTNEPYGRFFGAVVAFPVADFARVNGFSNLYWGWGFEDYEIRLRCLAAGLTLGFRDGTFRSMPHPQGGTDAEGMLDEVGRANMALFESRRAAVRAGTAQQEDGLSGAQYRTLEEQPIFVTGRPEAPPGLHLRVEV